MIYTDVIYFFELELLGINSNSECFDKRFFQEHLEEYFQYLSSIKKEKEFIEKFKNIIKYIESLENELKISDTMQLIEFIEKVFIHNNSCFIKNYIKEIKPLLEYKIMIKNN